jgi:penicillin-binding protein 1C
LGFERNLIHPETRLMDQPHWLGEYGPRNFDARYRGEVSIREALLRSLNTPAVRVLSAVGPLRLEQRLERLGVELRTPTRTSPGLPVALGGVGVTLEELTRLYAALGQGGSMRGLRFVADQQQRTLGRLLSTTASWYLDDILSESEPPAGFVRRRAIRFKTGTSYGYRDAWSIGYDGGYTVGVWVGRPDGGYSAGLVGIEAAAPLLHRVFELLPEAAERPSPPQDALLLSHAELPPNLRWFGEENGGLRREKPKIRFPVDGSIAQLDDLGDDGRFPLMVEGGKPPYHWLVDGEPLAGEYLWRRAQWLPQGRGRARITVIDGAGRADRAEIWVE